VPYQRFFVLSLIVGLPVTAAAQFTTFIPPQTRVADSVKAAAAVQRIAPRDTMLSTRLTHLKTWVDSAAGVAAPLRVTPDSVTPIKPVPPAADSATKRPPETAAPIIGERAPATASDLPLLALIGSAALGLGALILGTGGNRRMRTDA
jgi:hypothetical protein